MHPEETRIYIAVLIAGFILSTLVIFLFVTIVRYQRRQVASYSEKIVTDTNLMEQDRARIASDLHDDLGSSLSAIKIRLELLPNTDDYSNRLIEETKRSIDTTIQKIRQISNNMMPITLKQQGLKEALLEFITLLSFKEKFKINFMWNIKEDILPDNSNIHVYRIIQEVLNNTLKHAHATQVTIESGIYNSTFKVSITDNGIGFEKRAFKKMAKGLGLRNIMARADILKAKVFLNTEPGKRVTYQFFIPISGKDHF